jgi:transposase
MGSHLSHSELVDQVTLLSLRMEEVEQGHRLLKAEVLSVKDENARLRKENADLQSANQSLSSRNAELEAQLAEFRQKLAAYEVAKDSRNSNKPPSQDVVKQTESRRKKSGKSSGGQRGHKGHSLTCSSSPDEILPLIPGYCNQCGEALSVLEARLVSRRQVVDLPPIKPRYIEYQCYGIACRCGHFQQESYPSGVNSPIQYGERVGALVSYLSVYQYLPYRRLKAALKDLFGLRMSEGSIYNLLEKMKTKALPVYETIRASLEKAPVVGSDETSASVNGKKQWIWAWQDELHTYLAIDPSRGKEAIEAQFPTGLPQSILQSDRWPAQVNTPAAGYQLCLAHLERNLHYLEALEKQSWTTQFQKLIRAARKLKQQKGKYEPDQAPVRKLEKRLDRLLDQTFCQDQAPKTYTFRNSMRKHRDKILTFLYHEPVLPDNNASERAIRNVRIKQKISGQFKSGQQAFCVIRSVIDTALKRNRNVWEILSQTIALQPS